MSVYDEMNAMWNDIDLKDQQSKAKDEVIGRYVSYPYADGNAIYEVVAIDGNMATLEHIPYGDAWTLPLIEQMGCKLPLDAVIQNISGRDTLDAIFSKR